MPKLHRSYRILASALLTLTLYGCAAQRLHDEGMDLIDQGQVEDGLAKLDAAAKSDTENFSYRVDLIRTRERILNRLLQSADSARSAGHPDVAKDLYDRVLKIDSKNVRAIDGLHNLELDKQHAASMVRATKLFNEHDLEGAQNIVRSILLEDPRYKDAIQMSHKIDDQLAKDAIAGPTLKAEYKKPVTLEFRDANLKMVVEALSRTSGLNILLDKDVRGDLKTTIFVKDASVEDTVDLIALQNALNKKILSNNTILLYPNTPAKVKEYQDLMIRSFQLVNADAKEMEKMVKSLLKTHDMYVDDKTNALVIRDTPDAIRLADKLITAQDMAQPEVMLEVEVLEVTRSKLTELGIKFPEQIALSATGTPATTTTNYPPGGTVVTTTTPPQPLTLQNLGHLSSTMFNVSPLNASIDLRDETGDVDILASPRIRVRNREKAKILIGDRVPVITNAVTPVSTGSPVVTGTVQYLDVGLKLDVEPNIHPDDDVEIKVNLEVSNIVREIVSGPTLAYQIGTRTANTILRLKDGETQVLAGLISDEDRKAAQKLPGLGDLPVLGRLFSSHKNDAKKTEIVLSITPHLTRRNQRPDARNLEFWSGTYDNLRSKPITLEPNQVGRKHPAAALKQGTNNVSTQVTAPSPDMPTRVTNTDTHATQAAVANTDANPRQSATAAVDAASKAEVKPANSIALSWNGPQQAKVGEQFQVTIEAQTNQPLSSMSFNLGYDKTSLKIERISEGSLFNQNDKNTVFNAKIDPDKGNAFISISRLGPAVVKGEGSIAVVTFTVIAAKEQSPIMISSPNLVGNYGAKLQPPSAPSFMLSLKP